MKKYVKPELFYERFELNQHIADCQWEYVHEQGGCVAQGDEDLGMGAFIMFEGDLACNVTPDTYGEFCYMNSKDGSRLFNS